MKINKNEQDFVLKYFQPGKLDTRKALQKCGIMAENGWLGASSRL